MSSLIAARNLLIAKGFTGNLSFLDAAFDATDAIGLNAFGNPNTTALSDDIVFGNAGANILVGGKGNDILDGGAGADSLIGGEGIDWASYASATKGVTVNLAGPTWYSTGDARGDTFSSIENLMGSAFSDSLNGDAGDNVLSGLNGNDILSGGAGRDTLFGDAGTDTLYAGAGTDTLNGGADSDVLYGEGGDILNGDGGDDSLYAGAKADTMNGGDGHDSFFGARTPVAADAGNWQMNGGAGNDTFLAGLGKEAFNGGAQDVGGYDFLDYGNAASGVTVNLATGVGGGGASGDTYAGIEWVKGSVFDDTLTGSTGRDVLEGGLGNDHFFGGGESDAFVFDVTPWRSSIEGSYFGPYHKTNIGNDVIHDYDIQSSASDTVFDGVYFEGMTQTQFDQIVATQVGANTVLTSDMFDGSITLLNTDADYWHQI